MRPNDRPVLSNVALVELKHLSFALKDFIHQGKSRRDIVGMRQVARAERKELVRRITEHLAQTRVDPLERSVGSQFANPDGSFLKRRPETLFAIAQRRLCFFPVSDIESSAKHPNDCACVIAHTLSPGVNCPHRSIRPCQAHVHVVRLVVLD